MSESNDITACWFEGGGMLIAGHGYAIKPSNSDPAGYLRTNGGEYFLAKDSNTVVGLLPVDNNPLKQLVFWKKDDFLLHQHNTDGFIEYSIESEPTKRIYTEGGEPYVMSAGNFYTRTWYSKNKQWMGLLKEDNTAMIFDLRDYSVRTVRVFRHTADPSSYGSLAISDSGRHLATIMFGEHEVPIVTDIANCDWEQGGWFVQEPVSCALGGFGPELRAAGVYSEGENLYFPAMVSFRNEDELEFYSQGSEQIDMHIIKAATGLDRDINYLALGDSFASGEGAGSYLYGTDIPRTNDCHISSVSYPYLLKNLVKESVVLSSANSVACSGARIKNIIGPEKIDLSRRDEDRTNQYAYTKEEAGVFAPGFLLQNSFYNDHNIGISTVMIGGNDIGFESIISKCAGIGTCYKSAEDRRHLRGVINSKIPKLRHTYTDIKQRLAVGSKLYVIGYPEIIKTDGNCGKNVPLNAFEVQFGVAVTRYLNRAIQQAAKEAGVPFIDVSDALHGYRLCESKDPAVHGVSTALRLPPISPESFHPTAKGQRLIAEKIAQRTKGFTAPLTLPIANTKDYIDDHVVVQTGLLESHELVAQVIGYMDYSSPPYENAALRGGLYKGSLYSDTYGITPNTMGELWLNSTPVYVGSFKSDSEGVVRYEIQIPKDIETGYHTLYYYTKSKIDGEPLKVWQPVYILASYDDYDGDGLLNDETPCMYGLHSAEGVYMYDWCDNPWSHITGSTEVAQRVFEEKLKTITTFSQEDYTVEDEKTEANNQEGLANNSQTVSDERKVTEKKAPSASKKYVILATTSVVSLSIWLLIQQRRRHQKGSRDSSKDIPS